MFIKDSLRSGAVLVSFILQTGTVALYAQQKEISEQVQVIRAYKPVLGEGVKIKKVPSLQDSVRTGLRGVYTLKELRLSTDTASLPVSTDDLKAEQRSDYTFFLLKAAAGNYKTGLGQAFISSKPSKEGHYDSELSFLSQTGSLANQLVKLASFGVHGKRILRENAVYGNVEVKSKQVGFYGYNHDLQNFSSSESKQVISYAAAEASFTSLPDTLASLVYELRVKGYQTTDKFKNNENHFTASGSGGYTVLNFMTFSATSQVLYNKLSQESGTYNNSIFKAQPSVTVATKFVKFRAGLNLIADIGGTDRLGFFPDLSTNIVFDKGFNLFGGIKGDVLQNTYNDLIGQNPWLKSSASNSYRLNNTRENILFFAGIKGDLSDAINFNVRFDLGNYDNLPFFKNDPSDGRLFDIVYDGKGTVRERLSFGVFYNPSKRLRLDLEYVGTDYKLKTLDKPLHAPRSEAHFNFLYRASSSLLIRSGADLRGKVDAQSGDSPSSVRIVTLSSFADLHAAVEYKVSKRLSFFIEGQNLLNTKYENYLNYKVFGLGVRGGLTLSL